MHARYGIFAGLLRVWGSTFSLKKFGSYYILASRKPIKAELLKGVLKYLQQHDEVKQIYKGSVIFVSLFGE